MNKQTFLIISHFLSDILFIEFFFLTFLFIYLLSLRYLWSGVSVGQGEKYVQAKKMIDIRNIKFNLPYFNLFVLSNMFGLIM